MSGKKLHTEVRRLSLRLGEGKSSSELESVSESESAFGGGGGLAGGEGFVGADGGARSSGPESATGSKHAAITAMQVKKNAPAAAQDSAKGKRVNNPL